MFTFCKKMFIGLLSVCRAGVFDRSLASNSKRRIKFVSLDNQPCHASSTLTDTNSNETLFTDLMTLSLSVVKVVTLLMICMIEHVLPIK